MTTEQENIDRWRSPPIPLARHLGIDIARMAEGRSELRFTARPEHMNSFGVTHGGMLMSLLDITMAAAARSENVDMGVVTIEMKTTFMQPANGPLVGHGRVLHRTRAMVFIEGTVEDAEGRVCAHATGTFKMVPRPNAAD